MNSDNDHQLSLEKLTLKQWLSLKSCIVDVNNRLNEIFPLFISFSSRDWLIDLFSSHFYFYSLNRNNKESKKSHIWKLNKLIFQASACYNMVKGETGIFFIYSSGFYIEFYFEFIFLLLYWWWQ